MNRKTDDELKALLSPEHLSGPEHDQVFETVAKRVAPSRMPRFAFGLLALASVAVVSVVVPRLLPSPPELAAKGSKSTLVVDALCIPETCRPGSKLLVALSGVENAGYVGAYAVSPSGRIVWYFSGADSPAVHASRERLVLPRSLLLGEDQDEAGTWRLHVLISDQPATREDIVKNSHTQTARIASAPLEVSAP